MLPENERSQPIAQPRWGRPESGLNAGQRRRIDDEAFGYK